VRPPTGLSSAAEQQDYSLQVPVSDSGSPVHSSGGSAVGSAPAPSADDQPTRVAPEQEGRAAVAVDGDDGNMLEVGGSSPSPQTTLDELHRKWEIRLAEDHTCQTGVYLRRWRLETPWFSIRLHHWFASDDDRSMHDHPWDFITIPLRGSYLDEHYTRRSGDPDDVEIDVPTAERVRVGRIYYRPSTHAHWVHLDRGRVWTLVLTGPKIRRWGFWVKDKWVRSYRYFYRFGNHPCDS
jgi:hypothetical protein